LPRIETNSSLQNYQGPQAPVRTLWLCGDRVNVTRRQICYSRNHWLPAWSSVRAAPTTERCGVLACAI